jgi:hypothetical protein
MQNDNKLIFNTYARSTGSYLLNEADQAEADQNLIKQNFAKQLEKPEVQEAMAKQAEELKVKYQADIDKALEADGGTAGSNVEALLQKIQQEIEAQAQKQVKESIELHEGFFKRVGALASGAMKRAGDVMSNTPSTKGFRQEAILKRFESLKSSLGSQLRELQRDMETTSDIDTRVKDFVNRTVAKIETQYGYAPKSSKFQDFRHSAGKFTQNVLTGAVIALPVMALAAPVATAMGLTGVAAAAVAAGMTGGSVSMLKDLINGQKPDAKRAIVTGLASAAAAGLLQYGMDKFSSSPEVDSGTSQSPNAPQAPEAPEAPEVRQALPVQDPDDLFNTMHGSSFDPDSSMDQLKQSAQDVLWNKGIIGTDGGNAVPSPRIQNYIDSLVDSNPEKAQFVIDYIKDMPKSDAQDTFSYGSRKSGDAVKALRAIVKSKFG